MISADHVLRAQFTWCGNWLNTCSIWQLKLKFRHSVRAQQFIVLIEDPLWSATKPIVLWTWCPQYDDQDGQVLIPLSRSEPGQCRDQQCNSIRCGSTKVLDWLIQSGFKEYITPSGKVFREVSASLNFIPLQLRMKTESLFSSKSTIAMNIACTLGDKRNTQDKDTIPLENPEMEKAVHNFRKLAYGRAP